MCRSLCCQSLTNDLHLRVTCSIRQLCTCTLVQLNGNIPWHQHAANPTFDVTLQASMQIVSCLMETTEPKKKTSTECVGGGAGWWSSHGKSLPGRARGGPVQPVGG